VVKKMGGNRSRGIQKDKRTERMRSGGKEGTGEEENKHEKVIKMCIDVEVHGKGKNRSKKERDVRVKVG